MLNEEAVLVHVSKVLLRTVFITKAEFDLMKPKNAQPARAHGLLKTQIFFKYS